MFPRSIRIFKVSFKCMLMLLFYVVILCNIFSHLPKYYPYTSVSKLISGTKTYGGFRSHIGLSNWSPSVQIPLVIVVCNGSRADLEKNDYKFYYDVKRQTNQFRVMIGTLLYFSYSPKWRIILVTDSQETFDELINSLSEFPREERLRLTFERRASGVPEGKYIMDLLKQYRPCNWQKLFLDHVLPDEESVVYMDSDVLFTGPAENVWRMFSKFNESQAIGLGPEPWYIKDDIRPYAGKVGLNMGVMTLNLTRLRKLFPKGESFGQKVANEVTKAEIPPRHDQDMVNQFLNRESKMLYEFSVKWNFIPSDCTFLMPRCPECEEDGITIVHGADATFFREIDGNYLALFRTMDKLTHNLAIPPDVLLPLLVGAHEGAKVYNVPTICDDYRPFLSQTTHHLRKMASLTTNRNLHLEKYSPNIKTWT